MKLKHAVVLNAVVGIALVAGTGVYVAKLNKHSGLRMANDVALYVAITLAIMGLTYIGGLVVKLLV